MLAKAAGLLRLTEVSHDACASPLSHHSSPGPMVGDYATADVIGAGPCRGRAIESFAVGLAPQPDDKPVPTPNPHRTAH
jgi:hypothetical protein